MPDTIFLEGARFQCHLGVTENEREFPQEVIVDLEMAVDTAPAGTSDDLTKTVNYSDVWRTLHDCVYKQRFHLIETVAERIASAVLDGFPAVRQATVRVHKPAALAGRDVRHVGVQITRGRT